MKEQFLETFYRCYPCSYGQLSTDKLLKAGKLAEIKVGGGAATLTLPHLAKDDEGLYTLRMWTKDGTTEHSAYLFVKGKVIWSYNN
jgi:hypothetical protein